MVLTRGSVNEHTGCSPTFASSSLTTCWINEIVGRSSDGRGFHASMQLHKSISGPRSLTGYRVMCLPMSAVLVLFGAVLVAPTATAAAPGDTTSEPACPAPRRGDDGVLLESDADVFLGAFVQAHEPARDALLGCGLPLAQGVETLELFKWAVGLLNRDQGFVPGVKIGELITEDFVWFEATPVHAGLSAGNMNARILQGMRVFDSCGHKARAYLQLDALLPVLRGNSETCVSTANSSRVIGTLMTSTLRNEELIAGLLRDHDVPTIPLESSAIAPPEYLAKVIEDRCEHTKKFSANRRRTWLARIKRAHSDEQNGTVLVCGAYFVGGKPSRLFDETNPDRVRRLCNSATAPSIQALRGMSTRKIGVTISSKQSSKGADDMPDAAIVDSAAEPASQTCAAADAPALPLTVHILTKKQTILHYEPFCPEEIIHGSTRMSTLHFHPSFAPLPL
ncbi:hypothetical protein HPB51_002753 [Rhipicephalus microplus]|uniref:Uncharacterized protein n=1 Tax=Rhipicephalus microplus TaxID=6941 RepID=A0A9J6EWV8_RHIMP|nr:hypothetical protein HPB51_002753 [Rhipicephalus microplus]